MYLSERELFLKHIAQTSPFPSKLEIQKAKGVYLYLKSGQKCMDLISGIAVSSLGHCHPRVTQAIKHQLRKSLHQMVYGEFVESQQVRLAKALTDTLPKHLNNVYFVNSGSEAVEVAMKLAKKYTSRPNFLSAWSAYHGSTHGALSLFGEKNTLKKGFHPLLPGVEHIQFGIPKDLKKITRQTAAVIIEVIQSEAGIRISEKSYLLDLRKRCNETGTLLVFDEIQTGFGRTGKFWAFEHFDVFPDILLTAKAMGGGLPLGAVIADKKVMNCLSHDPILGHITTFGGNPVCCAASLATVQTLQKNQGQIIKDVSKKRKLFLQRLVHKNIVEVRSIGLHMAIELGDASKVQKVMELGLKKGLLLDFFLFNDTCFRIAPPLIISMPQIDKACRLLLEILDEVG